MSDIKQLLKDKFEEIYGYEPIGEESNGIGNALSIICQGKYKRRDVIELEDTSIFGNGKSGLVLTTDALCVKDAGNSTTRFIAKYEDIESTYVNEDSFLGTDITALELEMAYGSTYRISIDGLGKYKLMEFIDYARELYQEDDKLVW